MLSATLLDAFGNFAVYAFLLELSY